MKLKNYNRLIYFIAATIVATIAIQAYWNVQNYKTNKQRLINEVQISLDNGVEAYYADIAKTDIRAFVSHDIHSKTNPNFIENVFKTKESKSFFKGLNHKKQDSGKNNTKVEISEITFNDVSVSDADSITSTINNKTKGIQIFTGLKADSIRNLTGLANKIVISMHRDTIDFKKLNNYFSDELSRKKIAIGYAFEHNKKDSTVKWTQDSIRNKLVLSTLAKSTYLKSDESIELEFSNPTSEVLKRSLMGISLSFLLCAAIISCLLYLLHIIKKQKELAEIKNDLISNITHEFKTPIATVSAAIEGIQNFNKGNDPEKTKSYLNLSTTQLGKLHQMVEKLLETATLDNDKLLLDKEATDLVFMLKNSTEKHQMLADDKTISFTSNKDTLTFPVDVFHFENAVSNLIDNAVKYGGDTIVVNLNSVMDSVEISVSDNGKGIDKNQREKIFDKFYRVPTGNRHDVKGFGIGLFYTKKIIEKHNGSIQLDSNSKTTTFKIFLVK